MEGGQEGMAKALQEPVRKVPTDGLMLFSLGTVACTQYSVPRDGNPSRPRSPILPYCHPKTTKPPSPGGPSRAGQGKSQGPFMASLRRQQSLLPASNENKAPSTEGLVGFLPSD